MAKRRRLSPPQESYLAPAPAAAPETKSLGGPPGLPPRAAAPIAGVAAESAAAAALREVAGELAAAREEGRLVQRLPLGAVEADHLVRDRIAVDAEEMAALRESLRARGQQTPIEVVDLGGGRYGLISGWRRLMALQALHEETGEARFARVDALLRRPESAADAYVAMVEENEIRVGLGHYERARIAVLAAEQRVYPNPQEALRHLFASASRAKRSKIGSFIALHQALGPALRFPAAIPERLGLGLAQRLEAEPAFAAKLRERLRKADPADAAAEQAVLARALAADRAEAGAGDEGEGGAARPGGAGQGAAAQEPGQDAREIAPGVFLEVAGGYLRPRLTLSGPKVDAGFRARLEAWLRGA